MQKNNRGSSPELLGLLCLQRALSEMQRKQFAAELASQPQKRRVEEGKSWKCEPGRRRQALCLGLCWSIDSAYDVCHTVRKQSVLKKNEGRLLKLPIKMRKEQETKKRKFPF